MGLKLGSSESQSKLAQINEVSIQGLQILKPSTCLFNGFFQSLNLGLVAIGEVLHYIQKGGGESSSRMGSTLPAHGMGGIGRDTRQCCSATTPVNQQDVASAWAVTSPFYTVSPFPFHFFSSNSPFHLLPGRRRARCPAPQFIHLHPIPFAQTLTFKCSIFCSISQPQPSTTVVVQCHLSHLGSGCHHCPSKLQVKAQLPCSFSQLGHCRSMFWRCQKLFFNLVCLGPACGRLERPTLAVRHYTMAGAHGQASSVLLHPSQCVLEMRLGPLLLLAQTLTASSSPVNQLADKSPRVRCRLCRRAPSSCHHFTQCCPPAGAPWRGGWSGRVGVQFQRVSPPISLADVWSRQPSALNRGRGHRLELQEFQGGFVRS